MNFIIFRFDISHRLHSSMPTFASVVDMTWEWVKECLKSIVKLLMNSKAHTSVVLFFTLQYYVHIYIFRHLIHSSTIFFFLPWLYSIYTASILAILLLYYNNLNNCRRMFLTPNLCMYIFVNLFGSIFAACIIVLEQWFSNISIRERSG